MSLDKDDGAVEKLMEEGTRPVENAGDKYDELNKMEVSEHVETAYAGMGKEELMKYANSPFWVRLRWLLFVAFWLSWFAMMFGALFIIFMTPKCFPLSKLEWYQKSPVYVINVASLVSQEGLDSKIEYMEKLGVQSVVLSSVFKADGNEVMDFMMVNASLGSNNSTKDLITKLKAKGMKVMLKVIPNHSSTSSNFFERSVLNEPNYKDYFIWNPGFTDENNHYPINNWESINGGSAWTWNDKRKEFYLHQFSSEEPDFNFHNKYVVEYFENVFDFWLDFGFDGLYLDKVQYLFEDKDFKNNTVSTTNTPFNYNSFSPTVTTYLPETKELLSHWGSLIENKSKILIVSDLDSKDVTGVNIVHSPITLSTDFTGEQLLDAVLYKKTISSWPSWEWVCSNKSNCWTSEMVDAFNIISSLLPGTPFINADPKIFDDGQIPNITLIESTLKQLRSLPAVEFGSFNAKLLNNDTVFAFDRIINNSENLLFAWNLSKNVTILNLSSFDGVPVEANLSLCTQSACSILPPLKSKVDSSKLSLAAQSAVVLSF